MPGSLKSLSKALEAVLSSETTISDTAASSAAAKDAIQAFVEHEATIDSSGSSKLHDELVRLHNTHVKDNIHKEPTFLGYLRDLSPCLLNIDNLKVWFDYYRNPALDSAGHNRNIVKASTDFLLAVLCLPANTTSRSTSDISTTEKLKEYLKNSDTLASWLLEIYLDCSAEWKFEDSRVTNDAVIEEERRRYIRMNTKNILVAYGLRCVKAFLTILHSKFILRKFRLEVLVLLSIYVSRQPPDLHLIEETPLLESIELCLLHDISASLLTVCATTFAMILPHITPFMAKNIHIILTIYGRLCSWRSDFSTDTEIQEKQVSLKTSPLFGVDNEKQKKISDDAIWQVQNHIFQVDIGIKPKVTYLFAILYGLFPTNLVAFVQSPTTFLEQEGPFVVPDFWERHTITAVSRSYSSLFTLNPALLSYSKEEECSELKRFGIMGSTVADIASYCLQLYTPFQHLESNSFKEKTDMMLNEVIGSDKLDNESDTETETEHEAGCKPKPVDVEASSSSKAARDTRVSPSTATVSSPLQVLTQSPVIQDIDSLLNEHQNLYTHGGDSAPPRMDNALTSIPEVIDLSNDRNTHNSNGLRRRSIEQSPLQLAQVSPSLPPQSILSPPQVATVNVMSPSLEPLTTVPSGTSSIASSGGGRKRSSSVTARRASIESSSSVSDQQNQIADLRSQLEFYKREILLIKNELEFSMFIEYHSQYRYKKLKEQVTREATNSERFIATLEHNKHLKARVTSLVEELDKARVRMQTYREGTLSYETLMSTKNKQFRERVKELTTEIEKLTVETETLRTRNNDLEAAYSLQEKRISELEMDIEHLTEHSATTQNYSAVVTKLERELNHMRQQYLGNNDNSGSGSNTVSEEKEEDGTPHNTDNNVSFGHKLPTLLEYEELLKELEELRMFRDSADHDIRTMENNHEREMAEMRETIKFYENQERDGATQEVAEKIDNLKKTFEARYLELKATYEALAAKHTAIVKQYQAKILEFETLQAKIDEPILVKKSILQHDEMSMTQSDDVSRTSSGANTSSVRMLVRQPTEQRIRGRGGVQNMGTKDLNTKKKPRQNFRGINI